MKEKIFTVTIGTADYELTRGNTDVYLHRPAEYHDLDWIRVFDFDKEVATNIFRLPELARLMAGMAFKENGFPMAMAFKDGETFKDKYGWLADTYIRDKPSEESIEGFAMVDTSHDIDEQGRWSFGEV